MRTSILTIAAALRPVASVGLVATLSATTLPAAATAVEPVDNGKIVFSSNRDGGFQWNLYTMNPDGSGLTRLNDTTWTESQPSWSPDGSKIAFASTQNGGWEIHVMNADGGGEIALGGGSQPAWSPDGTKIAFQSSARDLWVMNADGSGAVQLTSGPPHASWPAWSPDGSRLVYAVGEHTTSGADLYTIGVDGTNRVRLTATNGPDETQARFSPDGTRIAFARNYSTLSPDFDIWVMNADGTGASQLTSGEARDERPAWSPDGTMITFSSTRELFNAEIFVMNVDGSGIVNISNMPTGQDALPDWAVATASAPDSAPPEISCDSPDGLWHGQDIVIACTAEDAGSGLADEADASFALSTSVPAGTEEADAATDTREVCDVAGNCATAGPIGGNMVDKLGPAVLISSPQAGTYSVGDVVIADYTCADGGSGTDSCDGTVAAGSPIDTSVPGEATFSVAAADAVGNEVLVTLTYTVDEPTPEELLAELVASLDEPSLLAKAQAAQASVARGSTQEACNQLNALANHVNAWEGNKLPPELSDSIQAAIEQIEAALVCRESE